MATLSFTATSVSYSVEDNCDVVAFYNDEQYLFLQRYQELGHKEDDGVYVECNDSVHVGFDVIEAISMNTHHLSLSLKSPLYHLPDVLLIEIALALSDEELAQYQQHLSRMFSDRSVVLDFTR